MQHVCSVVIFVCCFVGIFQERASPVAVVGSGSLATVFGWVLWDRWVSQEESASRSSDGENEDNGNASRTSSTVSSSHIEPDASGCNGLHGLGLTIPCADQGPKNSRSASASTLQPNVSLSSLVISGHPTGAPSFASYSYYPPYGTATPSLSPRTQQRLATAKSAFLIYCALLGLSPILKSLTKSTTSDSIWAMSCWLMGINVFLFDYGGEVGAK